MDPGLLQSYLDEYRSREPIPDRRPLGCLLILGAVAAFVLFPTLSRVLSLPSFASTAGLVLFGFAVLAGLYLHLFGSGRYGAVMETIDEAVDILTRSEEGPPDFADEEVLKAAVRLLDSAYFSDGPTTSGTYDPEEMARRLGPALEGVKAVERILVQEGAIYPVLGGGD